MKTSSWNIVAAGLLGLACTSALAGPNAGGALILHTDDSIVFSDGTDYYRESGRNCLDDFFCPDNPDLACETQVNNPTSGKAFSEPAVWWILAAFDAASCPRLSGVTFGVEWDSPGTEIVIIDWATCSDGIEIPTDGWPDWVGTGVGMTWLSPRLTRLTEVYWFAGYAYSPQTFRITGHPTQGSDFADDSVPSQIDPILPAQRGWLGLGGAEGFNPSPVGTGIGACCIEQVCTVETEQDCAHQGGIYVGDDSDCNPDPCAVMAVDTSWGRLKFNSR